jgi:hypothetical protein
MAFDRAPPGRVWDQLKHAGNGNPAREPSHLDWRTWGRQVTKSVTFASLADELPVDFEQLINAEFERPLAWLVGLQMSQATGLLPNTMGVAFTIIWGLGEGRFIEEVPAIVYNSSSSLVQTIGPRPAQSIYVSARALVAPNAGAPTFPLEASFTLGAFAAPQVW